MYNIHKHINIKKYVTMAQCRNKICTGDIQKKNQDEVYPTVRFYKMYKYNNTDNIIRCTNKSTQTPL